MSTDLETELREALHARAATITPDRLRRPVPARRSARRYPTAWVAAAALVLAAIVGIGFAVLGGQDSGDRVAAGDAPDLRSTAWAVTAVTGDGRRQPITSPEVSVAFHLDHRFDANDGVNFYSGRWRQSGDTVTISDVAGTLVGYGGHDPAVLAAQRGIGALNGAVSVSLRNGTLRLATHGVTVELSRRSGFQDTPAAEPSPTGSRTGGAPGSYVNGSEIAPAPSAS